MQWQKLTVLGSVSALLSVSSAGTAHAYRPFDGTDADVAELGEFELELGPAHYLREGGRNFVTSPMVLNLGIMPRTELVVDMVGSHPMNPYPPTPTAAGEAKYSLVDTDVFFKVLLRKGALQEEGGVSMAVEAGPLLPEIYGTDGYGASANLILSERWDWFTVHLNNTFELSRGALDPIWSNSLITEFEVSKHWRPVTELLWEADIKAGANLFYALAGFIWSVTDDFAIDAAGVIMTEAGEQTYEARLGLTWAVAVWEPQAVAPEEEEKNFHERNEEEEEGPAHKEQEARKPAHKEQHARTPALVEQHARN